jgi:uncharacterized lipoprotein YmbA
MNATRLCACGALLLLSACLSPREDPTRYFVLSPTGEAAGTPAAQAGPLLVLGPLRLPEYLLRPEIVRRAGPNQLEPSRIDRWAEPLDRAALRVLCLDLQSLRPANRVVPFPSDAAAQVALEIEVSVTAFEADGAGLVHLQGSWRASGTKAAPSPAPSQAHAFSLEHAGGDGATLTAVAAMSALLHDLAGDIAAGLGGQTP